MKSFSIVAATVFLVACAANDSASQREGFRLMLERGPCFGSCPAYRLQVSGTGEVVFNGMRFTAHDGQKVKDNLTTDQVDALIDAIVNADYFDNLKQKCERRVTDQSSFTMDVTLNERQGSAARYLGCLPAGSDAIVLLAEEVDKIVATEAWIK